jgi:hypothetical protein
VDVPRSLRGFNRIPETVISTKSVRTAQRYQKLTAGPCSPALLCGRATTTKKAHEDERRPRGYGGSPRSCLVGRTLSRAAPTRGSQNLKGLAGREAYCSCDRSKAAQMPKCGTWQWSRGEPSRFAVHLVLLRTFVEEAA